MADGLKEIEPGVSVPAEDAEAVWEALDKYLDNFRMPIGEYLDAHIETCVFPHVRIASQQVMVFPDAAAYHDVGMHAGDFTQSGWDHSAWTQRRIVQAHPEKIHVAVSFDRFDKDGELVGAEESFYIMEKIDGRWGVRGRSSFAK